MPTDPSVFLAADFRAAEIGLQGNGRRTESGRVVAVAISSPECWPGIPADRLRRRREA